MLLCSLQSAFTELACTRPIARGLLIIMNIMSSSKDSCNDIDGMNYNIYRYSLFLQMF